MATGPDYKLPHRRRREQKTDYEKRLELIKSGKPRAVVKRTNKHTRVQVIVYNRGGDVTEVSAFSKNLEEYGWEHHTGNLPAAYLTGFLAGNKALEEGLDQAVVDIGLQNKQYGTRIYAAVKGLKDAGVEVNTEERSFSEESRLRGEHIKEYKDNGIVENFEEVKEEIDNS